MVKERSLKEAPKDRLAKLVVKGMEREPTPTAGQRLEHLNTRIPSELLTEVKVHCARNRIRIQDFVTEILQEKLLTSE